MQGYYGVECSTDKSFVLTELPAKCALLAFEFVPAETNLNLSGAWSFVSAEFYPVHHHPARQTGNAKGGARWTGNAQEGADPQRLALWQAGIARFWRRIVESTTESCKRILCRRLSLMTRFTTSSY